MTTTNPNDEYQQVYDGIKAVAAACDGALAQDGVGFNGQDTKFGRRIASVPFETWSDDVRQEAARIALRYKQQILASTGVDMATLDVVREAADLRTNVTARDQARGFERLGLKAERKATIKDGMVEIGWAKGDPDFGDLLSAVKAIQGRAFDWDTKTWSVPVCDAAADLIEEFALAADFDIDTLRQVAQAAAEVVEYDVRPAEVDGKVVIFGYNKDALGDLRALPGRKFEKFPVARNYADATPKVLVFAERYGFTVDPAVVATIEAAVASGAVKVEQESVLETVSRSSDPAALPEEFLAQVIALCPKAEMKPQGPQHQTPCVCGAYDKCWEFRVADATSVRDLHRAYND